MPPFRRVCAVCVLLLAGLARPGSAQVPDSAQVSDSARVADSLQSPAPPDSVPAAAPAPAPDTIPVRRGPRKAVGAEVGYSRSDLAGTDASQLRSRQGALTGVFLQLPIGLRFSIRPEVLFALKGGRTQAEVDGGAAVPLDIELAYLEMPLLLRVSPGRGRFRPTVFGGPAPALQIGCDLQIVDPSTPARVSCSETDIGPFREFDIGIVGGAGLEVRWPQSALALEARYTLGRRSVVSGFDVKNRGWGVLLALTF